MVYHVQIHVNVQNVKIKQLIHLDKAKGIIKFYIDTLQIKIHHLELKHLQHLLIQDLVMLKNYHYCTFIKFSGNNYKTLPITILEEIMSFLPSDNIVSLSNVNKNWLQMAFIMKEKGKM